MTDGERLYALRAFLLAAKDGLIRARSCTYEHTVGRVDVDRCLEVFQYAIDHVDVELEIPGGPES